MQPVLVRNIVTGLARLRHSSSGIRLKERDPTCLSLVGLEKNAAWTVLHRNIVTGLISLVTVRILFLDGKVITDYLLVNGNMISIKLHTRIFLFFN